MRYVLKDYQADAVTDVLANLAEAREMFHNPRLRRTSSFALTATTGAGKTVMAAAAIEALFYGDDTFDFEADPTAVVLWFSDDPSLNEQTRFRLMAASDRLTHSDLVTISYPFTQEKLKAGKVYFLNTGKLTRSSLLTRGHDDGEDEESQFPELRASARPDLQGYTIWDTLQNTIEDPDLTLYMVLDEAHRGFGTRTSTDKPTIVRRLINGHAGVPPIPVVWGISATVKRFEDAMRSAEVAASRRELDRVTVDPVAVLESGLLKDTIVLDIPAEAGVFDTVLLARATGKIRESTAAWAEYARAQATGTDKHDDASGGGGDATPVVVDPVVPLMVLQLPNKPDPDTVKRALDVVFDHWPELDADAVAHVLGDHTTQEYGPYRIRYVAPERVQDLTEVRVLLAKDAISTGWDCPRAEVLVSFRPAKDATHITQLLGRMIRTPLARRIPGNERLNTVECLLPFFDRKTATTVVKVITGALEDFPGGGTGGGQKVVIDPQDMTPNEALPEGVWDALEAVPSQSLPRKAAKPVKRLSALAHALAFDGLRPDAGADAHAELHSVLDGCAARYADQVTAAVAEVWSVQGESVIAGYGKDKVEYGTFAETADNRSIQQAFRDAARVLGADVAGTYADRVAGPDDPDTGEDNLRDAYVKVAALATIPQVRDELDRAADALVTRWFDEHRVAIKDLSDERQAVYNAVKAMSTDPQRMNVTRPKNSVVETKYPPVDDDSDPVPMPTRARHLLSDTDGNYPIGALNGWEVEVLDRELSRTGTVAWYRNPSRSVQEAVTVAYKDTSGGGWRALRPDFVFFDQSPAGDVRVSIVDPHGHHLADAMDKLRGLAVFAAEYGDDFHRIEAVARVGDTTRVLDLQDVHVRAAVAAADNAKSLYESGVAGNY